MKTQRCNTIARILFLWAIFPSQTLCADVITGSWNGYTTETISYYSEAQLIDTTTTYFASTLTMSYDTNSQFISLDEFLGPATFLSYGPTSWDGFAIGLIAGPDGADLANFDLNYQSILPDNTLDTTNSSAIADITYIDNYFEGNGYIVFDSFSTTPGVPEPSSFALGATGLLALLGVFARRSRRAGA